MDHVLESGLVTRLGTFCEMFFHFRLLDLSLQPCECLAEGTLVQHQQVGRFSVRLKILEWLHYFCFEGGYGRVFANIPDLFVLATTAEKDVFYL